MSTEVKMFQCDTCLRVYPSEYLADECEFEDRRREFANYMFQRGHCLGAIKRETGIPYAIPKELNQVDKHMMFKIEYLQGEKDYVYGIIHINDNSLDVKNTRSGYTTSVSYDTLVRGLPKTDIEKND